MNDQPKHTPGDWLAKRAEGGGYVEWYVGRDGEARAITSDITDPVTGLPSKANAHLIAAAPDQYQEMRRYLPVLERAESDPELWAKLTEGLGIATLNGYRAAIAKAEGRGE